ncbi:MAG: hypothetical protein HRT69_00440 [Flavobacteriaceae bacterium]|nr:hypothetical protein [Flavobacteriaceae bacterium]
MNGVPKCNYNILVDSDVINNGRNLAIAKVIIHESIHAHLTYLYSTDQITLPIGSTDTDFINLFNGYISFLSTSNPLGIVANTLNDLQHAYMQRYVDDMISALRNSGLSMGYNTSSIQMTDDYLKKLVFGGSMEETSLFSEVYPEFNDREEIHWLGIAESLGVTQYYIDEDGSQSIGPISNVVNSNSPCF